MPWAVLWRGFFATLASYYLVVLPILAKFQNRSCSSWSSAACPAYAAGQLGQSEARRSTRLSSPDLVKGQGSGTVLIANIPPLQDFS